MFSFKFSDMFSTHWSEGKREKKSLLTKLQFFVFSLFFLFAGLQAETKCFGLITL